MEENKIELNRKHVGLRIIIFVASIVVAGTFISLGIVSLLNPPKDSGEYIVSGSDYDEDSYKCAFYLEGKEKEIKSKLSQIKDVYNSTLEYTYKRLNPSNDDEAYYGISYLNKNLNKDIKIDKYVYDTLLSGYNYSTKYSNYSLFSKPLYDYWMNLFQANKNNYNTLSDPINNGNNRFILEKLVSYINSKEHIDIHFKEDNVVLVKVSDEYLNFINNDINFDTSLISLNILYDSIISDSLLREFKENSFTKGYFISQDNLFILNNETRFDIRDSKQNKVGHLEFKEDEVVTISQIKNYLSNTSNEEYYSYYQVGDNIRTKYIDISSGLPLNKECQNIFINKDNMSLVELSLDNNEKLVKDDVASILCISSSKDDEFNLSKGLESFFVKTNDNILVNYL